MFHLALLAAEADALNTIIADVSTAFLDFRFYSCATTSEVCAHR